MKIIIPLLFALLLIPLIPAGFSDANNAHNIATNYMLSQSQGASGSSEAIPIIFSVADGEKLIIGISAHVLSQGITYTENQVQEFLNIDTPIEIKYMLFETQSASGAVLPVPESTVLPVPESTVLPESEDTILEELATVCFADTIEEQYQEICQGFLEDIEEESIAGASGASGFATGQASNPCDTNPGGLYCYYYNRYIAECLPPNTASHCSSFAYVITSGGYTLPTGGSADTTPPTITAPADISQIVTSTNPIAVTLGNAVASDNSGAVTITNNAPSLFGVGTRTITWTATDGAGNVSTDTQTVTLIFTNTPTNPINPSPVTIPAGIDIFSDDFENGLGNWVLSGDGNWRADRFDEYYYNAPLYTASDKVAESDNCDDYCIMTSDAIDISGQDWAYLEFGRFVDRSFDNDEGLKVELYDGNSWNVIYHWTDTNNSDDDTWHVESFNLSEYLVSGFKIRITAESSSSSEEGAINNVRVVISDAPILNPTPVTIPAGSDIFSDDFESGLDKWTLSGDSWRTGVFDESYRNSPLYLTSDVVAESDNCDNPCIMTSNSIDISDQSWAYLEFGRFIDRSVDYDEGLKVELYDGNSWNVIYHWTDTNNSDDDAWHVEGFNLSNYLMSDFKIRFTADTSSSSEDIGINNVRVVTPTPLDTTPPTITAPADITVNLPSGETSTSITLVEPIVSDESEYIITNNAPSVFTAGTHIITWTVTDASSNVSTATQRVIVNEYVFVDITPPVVMPLEDITVNLPSGENSTSITLIDPIVSDESSYTITNNATITFDAGTYSILWTVTDIFGNISTAIQNVFVNLFGPEPKITEFYGGNKLVLLSNNSTHSSIFNSTVTLGATVNGVEGLAVSNHSIRLSQGYVFDNFSILNNSTGITLSTSYGQVIHDVMSDSAFIPILQNDDVTVNSKVQNLNGVIRNVIDGELYSIPDNSVLTIYGINNNGDGLLLFKNATAFDAGNVHSLGVALYPSQRGDSGSPIILQNSTSAEIVGLHRGGVCHFDPNVDGHLVIDIRNSSSLCVVDNFYYKLFTPWESVKIALNLQ